MARGSALVPITWLVLGAVLGCGTGDAPRLPADDAGGRPPVAGSVRFEPGGGTITDEATGVRFEVPAGAVTEPVDVRFVLDPELPASASSFDGEVIASIALEPDGLVFETPIVVTLPLRVPVEIEDPVSHWLIHDVTGDDWEPGALPILDPVAGVATVELDSFSVHLVYRHAILDRTGDSVRLQQPPVGTNPPFAMIPIDDATAVTFVNNSMTAADRALGMSGPPLFVSNSPEVFARPGDATHCPIFQVRPATRTRAADPPVVLLRSGWPSGTSGEARLFLHHVNQLSNAVRVVVALVAPPGGAVQAERGRMAFGRVGGPLAAGTVAERCYLNDLAAASCPRGTVDARRLGAAVPVPAGEVRELFAVVVPAGNGTLSAIGDLQVTGARAAEAEIAVLVTPFGVTTPAMANAVRALVHMPHGEARIMGRPWSRVHVRGVFAHGDRDRSPAWAITADGTRSWAAQLVHRTGGTLQTLANDFEPGTDPQGNVARCGTAPVDGPAIETASTNSGNYGVVYDLPITVNRAAGDRARRRFLALANFRGMTIGAGDASALVYRIPTAEEVAAHREPAWQRILLAGGGPKVERGWVLGRIELAPAETDGTFHLQLSAPGGANLPLRVVLLPTNVVASVTVLDAMRRPVDRNRAPYRAAELRFRVKFNYAVRAADLPNLILRDERGMVVQRGGFRVLATTPAGAPRVYEAILAAPGDLMQGARYHLAVPAGAAVLEAGDVTFDPMLGNALTPGPSSDYPEVTGEFRLDFATGPARSALAVDLSGSIISASQSCTGVAFLGCPCEVCDGCGIGRTSVTATVTDMESGMPVTDAVITYTCTTDTGEVCGVTERDGGYRGTVEYFFPDPILCSEHADTAHVTATVTRGGDTAEGAIDVPVDCSYSMSCI